jgi:hypothetical protein
MASSSKGADEANLQVVLKEMTKVQRISWLKAAFETPWLCSWTMFVISRVSPSLQRTLIDIGHFIWNVLKKHFYLV